MAALDYGLLINMSPSSLPVNHESSSLPQNHTELPCEEKERRGRKISLEGGGRNSTVLTGKNGRKT